MFKKILKIIMWVLLTVMGAYLCEFIFVAYILSNIEW